MRRIAPIFGVLILVVLLVLVNRGINNSAHPDNDDEATQSSQQAAQTKPAPTMSATATPGVDLSPEVTIGDPAKAKYKITVGWVYDEANQVDPQALRDALQTVEKAAQNSGGTASAEIVDLDVPPGDLTPLAGSVTDLGVSVNGKPLGTGNPGEQGLTANALMQALQQSLAGK